MSISCMAMALRQDNLNPATKFILIILADHADDEGLCWPGQKGMAEKACMTDRQVRRHIAKLKNLELISIERIKRADGSWGGNKYSLNLAKMSYPTYQKGPVRQDTDVLSDRTLMSYQEPSIEPSIEIDSSKEESIYVGQFKNVKLSAPEYEKLKLQFNGSLESKIESLSEYIASKGKKYKSHYATILQWARKDGHGQQQQRTFETKAESLIRKQREESERARELLRGTAGHGAGSADSSGTDTALRSRLIGPH